LVVLAGTGGAVAGLLRPTMPPERGMPRRAAPDFGVGEADLASSGLVRPVFAYPFGDPGAAAAADPREASTALPALMPMATVALVVARRQAGSCGRPG